MINNLSHLDQFFSRCKAADFNTLPQTVPTFKQTPLRVITKQEHLNNLKEFLHRYAQERLNDRSLTTKQRQELLQELQTASELAVEYLQEGKNHCGRPNFANSKYSPHFNHQAAIHLMRLLLYFWPCSCESWPYSLELIHSNNPSYALNILCTHRNVILSNRKLSLCGGTNYTNHAKQLLEFIRSDFGVHLASLNSPAQASQNNSSASGSFASPLPKSDAPVDPFKDRRLMGMDTEAYWQRIRMASQMKPRPQEEELEEPTDYFIPIVAQMLLAAKSTMKDEVESGELNVKAEQLTDANSLKKLLNDILTIDESVEVVDLNGIILHQPGLPQDTASQIIRAIKQKPQIKYLDLSACGLSEEDLIEVTELSQLKYLFISMNTISDRVVNRLTNLTNLRGLMMDSVSLNDSQVESIFNLQQLEQLSICENQLTQLPSIGKLKKLEILNIADNPISAANLQQIVYSLPNLTGLNVDDDTAKILKSLDLSRNPDLSIYQKNPPTQ